MGLKFTEDVGLVEDGNNVFGETDQNNSQQKQLHYDDAGYGEIRKEKKRSFSRQSSLLTFSNYLQGLHASPPVLLDNENDDPDGPPTVLKDVPPPSTVIYLS